MASERPRGRGSVFDNFRVQVVLRVLVLAVTLGVFLHVLPTLGHPAVPVLLGLFVAWQLWSLVRFVDRTNRDVARFFQAVRHADFSQTFVTGGLGSSFDELKRSFNEVLDDFRAARAEKEAQALYLQMVVQHVGVALVAFDREGRVSLINTVARRLLRVNRLGNIAELDRLHPGLAATLTGLGPRRKSLVRLEEDGEVRQLACYATLFRTGEQEHRLVSLHDIQSELEEQEMESWQRLIRVLTHEIMNSITPIASLASTAEDLLQQEALGGEEVADVRTAVDTIRRRSQGLLHFVDAYRGLTNLPAPEFQVSRVDELFERVARLMEQRFREAGIDLGARRRPAIPRADRRPRAGGAGADQPAGQRLRGRRRPGRGAGRADRLHGPGTRSHRGRRQRARHRRGGPGQDLHPLLHHPAGRLGDRPEPLPADHAPPPGHDLGEVRTGRSDRVLPAVLIRCHS